MTWDFDVVTAFLGRLVPLAIRRWIRRRRAAREIEQIRRDIDACAVLYQALTQTGTVQWRLLPAVSVALTSQLHADGFLSDQALTRLQEFFAPAQQANALLTSPSQGGPAMLNEARRMGYLRQGRDYVETRDSNGLTLHDRIKGELAAALTKLSRQPV